MSKIECIKYHAVLGNRALQASFSLYVEKMGLKIHQCTLFKKDGKRWISLPTKSYEDKEGKTHYTPVVEFADKALQEKFLTLALKAVDDYLVKENGPSALNNQTQMDF